MTKNRPFFFSLVGCAGVCLILRIILKLTAIDPATGFYEGGGALPLRFNIVLGMSVLLLLAAGFFAGREPKRYLISFSVPLRVLSFATGIALFCQTVLDWRGIERIFTSGMPILLAILYLVFRVILCWVTGFLFCRIPFSGPTPESSRACASRKGAIRMSMRMVSIWSETLRSAV